MRPKPEQISLDDGTTPEGARPVGAWLQLLLRAIKTTRLYGEQNPAALQFHGQVVESLTTLLDLHGPMTLDFTAHSIRYKDAVVHQSSGRDDQLAMLFFRDGIQALTFEPGIGRTEVEAFLQTVAPMLGRERSQDCDLVTLLWDAELPHVQMRYVSAEADLEIDDEPGERERSEALGPPMAWPASGSDPAVVGVYEAGEPGSVGVSDVASSPDATLDTRSDDWTSGDPSHRLDAEFERIESEGQAARERFLEERAAEREMTPHAALLELLEEAVQEDADHAGSEALISPLRRLLQESITQGDWSEATRAQATLLRCGTQDRAPDLWKLLARPDSAPTRGVIARLDARPQAELMAFVEFVRSVGPPSAPWLIRILAESQQQRVRRELVGVLAEASRLDLSAIDRSLDDARWYVVRNLAVTLRSIGGQPVVSLLDRIANHPERRVRLEVLAALAEVPAESARPILLRMLDTPDVRELSGALRLLAAGRDPEVAQLLLQRLVAPDFVERTPEEHRAVLSALAVTGADQAVTPLALQLSPLQKPAAHSELLLKSIAQALSRIGTPEARAALELARSSRWSAVKDAATLALSMMRPR